MLMKLIQLDEQLLEKDVRIMALESNKPASPLALEQVILKDNTSQLEAELRYSNEAHVAEIRALKTQLTSSEANISGLQHQIIQIRSENCTILAAKEAKLAEVVSKSENTNQQLTRLKSMATEKIKKLNAENQELQLQLRAFTESPASTLVTPGQNSDKDKFSMSETQLPKTTDEAGIPNEISLITLSPHGSSPQQILDVADLNADIIILQAQKELLTGNINDMQSRMEKISSAVHDDDQIGILKSQMRSTNDALNEQMSEIANRETALKAQVQELTRELNRLKEQFSREQGVANLQEIDETKLISDQEHSALNSKSIEYETVFQDLEIRYKQLEVDHSNVFKALQSILSREPYQYNLPKNYSELLGSLEARLESALESKAGAVSKCIELRKKLDEAAELSGHEKNLIAQLAEENEVLARDITALNTTAEALRAERDELNLRVPDKEDTGSINELERLLEKQAAEVARLRQFLIETEETHTNDSMGFDDALAEYKQQILILERTKEELDSVVDQERQARNQLEHNYSECKSELNEAYLAANTYKAKLEQESSTLRSLQVVLEQFQETKASDIQDAIQDIQTLYQNTLRSAADWEKRAHAAEVYYSKIGTSRGRQKVTEEDIDSARRSQGRTNREIKA